MSVLVQRLGLSSNSSTTKWTFSAWVKRSRLVSSGSEFIFSSNGERTGTSNYSSIFFENDTLRYYDYYNSAAQVNLKTNRVFRDLNAWYHIVVRYDSTLSTADDRIRFYINGVQETSMAARSNVAQNDGSFLNRSGYDNFLGTQTNNLSGHFLGTMSHVHLADGQSYAPTVFGETDATTGIWKINTAPTVTYGTNGFFILKDNNVVNDQSGQGNNFSIGSGTLTATQDCPSNVFCTWNPLAVASYAPTYYNANTTIMSEGNSWYEPMATLGFSSGKFYWEAKHLNNQYTFIGVVDSKHKSYASNSHAFTTGVTIYRNDDGGEMIKDNVYTTNDYGTFNSDSDVMGIACDMDNKTISIYKNGSAIVSNFALSTLIETAIPYASLYQANNLVEFNFGDGIFATSAVSSAGNNASGNGIFEYDVPSGYTALSTKGLNL